MTKKTILKCKKCKFKWEALPITVYDACPLCLSKDWILEPIPFKMKNGTLVGTIEYDDLGDLVYFPEILAPLTINNLLDLVKLIVNYD